MIEFGLPQGKKWKPNLIRWPGSKNRTAANLIELAGRCDEWREPFLGSGATVWQLPDTVKHLWLNDVNDWVINLFLAVKNNTDDFHRRAVELVRAYNTNAKIQGYWQTAIDMCRRDCPVHFWWLCRLAHPCLVSRKRSNIASRPRYIDPARYQHWFRYPTEILSFCRHKLRNATITLGDYKPVFAAPSEYLRTVVYADPPYGIDGLYEYELSEPQHVQLWQTARHCKHRVVMTVVDDALMATMYGPQYGFAAKPREYTCNYGGKLGQQVCRKGARELYVRNFDLEPSRRAG